MRYSSALGRGLCDRLVDDKNLPEYVDPGLRGHAFLAIVVQFRYLENALSLRMLYFNVTGAVRWVGDHFECEFSNDVEGRLRHVIDKCQQHKPKCDLAQRLEESLGIESVRNHP